MKELDILILDACESERKTVNKSLTSLVSEGYVTRNILNGVSFILTNDLPAIYQAMAIPTDDYIRQYELAKKMGVVSSDMIRKCDEMLKMIPDYCKVLIAMSKSVVDCTLTLEETLVHELVHAGQILDGRLLQHHDIITWEGEKYKLTTDINSTYFTYPWEQEAYSAQAKYLSSKLGDSPAEHMQRYAATFNQ